MVWIWEKEEKWVQKRKMNPLVLNILDWECLLVEGIELVTVTNLSSPVELLEVPIVIDLCLYKH